MRLESVKTLWTIGRHEDKNKQQKLQRTDSMTNHRHNACSAAKTLRLPWKGGLCFFVL